MDKQRLFDLLQLLIDLVLAGVLFGDIRVDSDTASLSGDED